MPADHLRLSSRNAPTPDDVRPERAGENVPRPAAAVNRPEPAPDGTWPERYRLIDGWRGLAALAVVIHHVTGSIFIGGPAVLLFFVISGYCIAASADSCKRRGLGFGVFMLRRVRRIYPPYLLSIAFWAVTRAAKWVMTGQNDLNRPILHWIQNITLTQWLSLLPNPSTAASTNRTLFVAAYWSLCYEEQFYLLMGLMLLLAVRTGIGIRAMVSALMVVGLIWNVIFPEMACGLFIEYWAMFGFGVLVFYRLCRITDPRKRRLIDIALLAVIGATIYIRWFAGLTWRVDDPALTPLHRAEMRLVYEELLVAAAFAIFLIATRRFDRAICTGLWYRPLAALGQITFSLYLIHQFNLTLVSNVAETILHTLSLSAPRGPGEPATWYSLVLQIALHTAMASVFWYFCERPFLNKSLPGGPPRPAPSPSGLASPNAGAAC